MRSARPPQDRKFGCPKCEKKFFTPKDLRRHENTHLGLREHVCPSCQTRFGRKDHLTRHAKKSCSAVRGHHNNQQHHNQTQQQHHAHLNQQQPHRQQQQPQQQPHHQQQQQPRQQSHQHNHYHYLQQQQPQRQQPVSNHHTSDHQLVISGGNNDLLASNQPTYNYDENEDVCSDIGWSISLDSSSNGQAADSCNPQTTTSHSSEQQVFSDPAFRPGGGVSSTMGGSSVGTLTGLEQHSLTQAYSLSGNPSLHKLGPKDPNNFNNNQRLRQQQPSSTLSCAPVLANMSGARPTGLALEQQHHSESYQGHYQSHVATTVASQQDSYHHQNLQDEYARLSIGMDGCQYTTYSLATDYGY